MASDERVIEKIIKKYGPIIDLRKNPEIMLDILRKFADGDGGSPPGGAPNPPPGPTSFQDRVTNEELMRAILQVSRQIKALGKVTQRKSR